MKKDTWGQGQRGGGEGEEFSREVKAGLEGRGGKGGAGRKGR
jgi:hypothetical protein